MPAGRLPRRRSRANNGSPELPDLSALDSMNPTTKRGGVGLRIPDRELDGYNPDPDMMRGNVDGLSVFGVTGLRRNGGILDEEQLLELRGDRGRKQVRLMIDEDPIIGAFLFAIEMLVRQVDFDVEPASPDPVDIAIAEYVRSCLFDDMSHTWQDTLAEIITMLPWGWAFFEIVWKRRNGEHPEDATQNSQFNDGRIGIRKLSIRAQETLNNWLFDESGGVQAMVQVAPPKYTPAVIPIEKALLFRTTSRKNSPEGRSILRNAFRSFTFKRNIERIEAIGIERDLAGFPMAWVPPAYLLPTASNDQKAMTAAMKKMVTNVRRDEQEGAVFPLAYDQKTGNKLFDFTLLNSGGTRSFDTSAVIQRYDQRIAASVLADFILLGSQAVGSFALASSKTSLFSIAIGTYMDSICEVINRYLISRLLRLNGWSAARPPHLTHGDIETIPLPELAQYITALSGAGLALFPSADGQLEKYVLDVAGLPVSDTMNQQPADGLDEQDPAAPQPDGLQPADANPPANPPTPAPGDGLSKDIADAMRIADGVSV